MNPNGNFILAVLDKKRMEKSLFFTKIEPYIYFVFMNVKMKKEDKVHCMK